MSTSQPIPPRTPLVGGKYRLDGVIGSGGVGTVYRATHLWTEREVAVKVLDLSLPHFRQLREAFLMEARAAVQLQHPNVVEVLDMGEDEAGTTYMVMELLDGPTLRDVLDEQGRLSPEETARILLPIIEALDNAHELGIVHKDFKPENIILSVDAFDVMTPKLLDFGVAQVLRETRSQDVEVPDAVIVGTPQYMSPEQARDQRDLIGPQTDVWGVGVVWYECLTGRSPFDRSTPLEVLHAVCEAPIDFAGIPPNQASFLQQALERSTRRRTQRLSELSAQIERSGLALPAPTRDRVARSSRPPASDRPSYARRTLQGVGPSGHRITGARRVRFDSEPLSLPKRSSRKSVFGGLALTIAVGLAAWWTIEESRPLGSRIPKSSTVELTRPERIAEPREAKSTRLERNPEPEAADVIEPGRNREPEPVTAPSGEAPPTAAAEEVIEVEHSSEEPVVPVQEALPDPQPRAVPTKAASKTTTPRTAVKPRVQRPVDQEKPAPSSRPGYQKPPDLVTEW